MLIASTSVCASARGADAPETEAVYEAVVTGTRSERRLDDVPVATEVISRETIEASGARHLGELLETHPGVQVERSFRGEGLRMQGLGARYVLILMDGKPIGGRFGGTVDLARLSLENAERIEIVKGASSALYGSDAIAGVVNIVTRTAKEGAHAAASASHGTRDSWDMSGETSWSARDVAIRAWASWFSQDAYRLVPEAVATTGSSLGNLTTGLSGAFEATSKLDLEARVTYSDRVQEGVDATAAGAVFDRTNRQRGVTASADLDLLVGGAFKLHGSMFSSWLEDELEQDQRGSDALDQQQRQTEWLHQAHAQLDLLGWDRHLTTLGIDVTVQELGSPRLQDDGSRLRVAPYVQDEWLLSENHHVTLVPGARLDWDTQFGTAFSPKLAVRHDPGEALVLRASVGTGFRAPSFQELLLSFENPSAGYVIEGNPELDPERSLSSSVSAQWQPSSFALITVNAFRNDVRDLIVTDVVAPGSAGAPMRFGYINIARAATQGVEAAARLVGHGFTAQAGSTLVHARDVTEDRAIANQAPVGLTALVRWQGDSTTFQAAGAWTSERPFYIADPLGDEIRQEAPAYTIVDIRTEQRLGDHLSLFAGIDNALNVGDAEELPVPPRRFYLGASGSY